MTIEREWNPSKHYYIGVEKPVFAVAGNAYHLPEWVIDAIIADHQALQKIAESPHGSRHCELAAIARGALDKAAS